MNSQSAGHSTQLAKPDQTIPYTQLVPMPMVGSEPQIRFRTGHARVVLPGEGIILDGELLDCPERDAERGWVVLRGEKDAVAAGSPVLRDLMIENSPCHLRLESIVVRVLDGRGAWDWLAFELSPTGSCIQVSDDPIGFIVEPPSAPPEISVE